ncbi:ATP-binding cassette domain-containing protein [Candidatus Peregrinibacteria bacterium]|nr:ATP-binding cassette domain-containing protein [Candidatus Peregrinibacteria bacterium]
MSVIHVRGLRKKYGEHEALKGLSFDIEKGEVVGFLGPNGAGKTTTMKILTCTMSATSGEAHVAGHDCLRESMAVRRTIGYLPENNPLYTEMTVAEYLLYMAELHGVAQEHTLERLGVVAGECGIKDRLNDSIGTLSKGYRQRVGIAAALIHDPEILILDEPTVGLDPNQIIEIRNLIKKMGQEKTVVLCSHILAEVELTCNRIMIVNEGQIVASGTPGELRNLVEGHANLKLVIRGDKRKAMTVLKEVPGVKDVKALPAKEKGAHLFEVSTAKKKDLREAITQAIFTHELILLEIHKETVSLEAIFNQVTNSDKQ